MYIDAGKTKQPGDSIDLGRLSKCRSFPCCSYGCQCWALALHCQVLRVQPSQSILGRGQQKLGQSSKQALREWHSIVSKSLLTAP